MIGFSGRRIGLLGSRSPASFCPRTSRRAPPTPTRQPRGRVHPPSSGEIETTFGPRIHPLLNVTRQHDGIDYFAAIGDPVIAAASGEVRFAENKGEFGIAVEIRHEAGWVTFYAHFSCPSVRAGDCVKAGDVIGSGRQYRLLDRAASALRNPPEWSAHRSGDLARHHRAKMCDSLSVRRQAMRL